MTNQITTSDAKLTTTPSPKTTRRAHRSSQARTCGISLLFSEPEREALRLVSLKRKLSYSHTLRTLVMEEMKRLWPQGLAPGELIILRTDELESKRKADEKSFSVREAKLEAIRKKQVQLREDGLLVEEELRRMKQEKRSRKRSAIAPKASLAEPAPAKAEESPRERSAAVAAWYAKRALQEERAEGVRVRGKLPAG